jgi:hypothetical protein
VCLQARAAFESRQTRAARAHTELRCVTRHGTRTRLPRGRGQKHPRARHLPASAESLAPVLRFRSFLAASNAAVHAARGTPAGGAPAPSPAPAPAPAAASGRAAAVAAAAAAARQRRAVGASGRVAFGPWAGPFAAAAPPPLRIFYVDAAARVHLAPQAPEEEAPAPAASSSSSGVAPSPLQPRRRVTAKSPAPPPDALLQRLAAEEAARRGEAYGGGDATADAPRRRRRRGGAAGAAAAAAGGARRGGAAAWRGRVQQPRGKSGASP